jgi:plasmid replication initiation protein
MLPIEVRKSNVLVRARWRTDTVYALRVVALVAARISSKDKDFKSYSFPAAEIFQVNSADELGGWSYRRLKELATQIAGTPVTILDDPINEEFEIVTLFTKCRYSKKSGLFEVQFHPDLKSHFLQLREQMTQYTQYNLLEFLRLPSIYAQRLFEVLCSYHKTHPEVIIDMEDLQDRLAVAASLKKDFKDFRKRVLEPAHKSISKKTSLVYEWEPVRKGRKVTAVRFIFSKKRAEPVAKVKKAAADQKQSQGRNSQYLEALACGQKWKVSGGSCKQDRGAICTLCLSSIQKYI